MCVFGFVFACLVDFIVFLTQRVWFRGCDLVGDHRFDDVYSDELVQMLVKNCREIGEAL